MRCQIDHKGTEWESMTINGKWATWDISIFGDEVEIQCSTPQTSATLFLSQGDLKQLVEFLQRKIKS